MMCASLNAFFPLVHFGSRYNLGPTSRKLKGLLVGVIGIGGVGHFGLLFTKTLGAQRVVAVIAASVSLDYQMMGNSRLMLGRYPHSVKALLGVLWARQTKSERCCS
ncbi:uncharacterized protein TrAtP1_007220 [Trichoderma atroviride]|uniref:uncharacterized protein n=1 Tax=Hypocrea atroviridis TaxID=63577 RepID=UPI0033278986|nr:hypothetical protein TrAtP1_007220 [Trichoderma atroviride]